MKTQLREVIEAGKALSPDEREIAALVLLQGDDDVSPEEQAQIDAEWDEVIHRRLDDITSGRVKPVSGRETRRLGRDYLDRLDS